MRWLMLTLVACGGQDAADDPPPDRNPNPVQGASADTGFARTYLEPVAVAVEFEGGLDDAGVTDDYLAPVNGLDTLVPPNLLLTFASEDYFTQANNDDESCLALALFQAAPLVRGDHFPTADGAVLHQAYEVALDLDPTQTNCGELVDPATWGENAEDLLAPFVGLRIGLGWAPVEAGSELESLLPPAITDDPELRAATVAQYVALPQGGEFVGVARGFTLGFGFDPATHERAFRADDDDALAPVDLSFHPPTSAITGTFLRDIPVFFPALADMDLDGSTAVPPAP